MPESVKVFKITNPDTLDSPEVRDLFGRALANPKFDMDAEEARKFLQRSLRLQDGLFWIWVTRTSQHGLCGLSVVATGTFPLAPHPYIALLFAEAPEARKLMLSMIANFLSGRGHRFVAALNMTDKSDQAYLRIGREFARGTVKGSMILYEIGERYARIK